MYSKDDGVNVIWKWYRLLAIRDSIITESHIILLAAEVATYQEKSEIETFHKLVVNLMSRKISSI